MVDIRGVHEDVRIGDLLRLDRDKTDILDVFIILDL